MIADACRTASAGATRSIKCTGRLIYGWQRYLRRALRRQGSKPTRVPASTVNEVDHRANTGPTRRWGTQGKRWGNSPQAMGNHGRPNLGEEYAGACRSYAVALPASGSGLRRFAAPNIAPPASEPTTESVTIRTDVFTCSLQ